MINLSSVLPGTVRSSLSGNRYAKIFEKGAGILLQGSDSGTIGIISPASPTSYVWTLPDALPAGNKIIQVSSTGVLSLIDQAIGGLPAGSGTEIQYRNGTAFGAVFGSSWDATTLTVPKLTSSGKISATNFATLAAGVGNSVTIGDAAVNTQGNYIVIGTGASSYSLHGVVIGNQATNPGYYGSTVIGSSAACTAANQFVAGSDNYPNNNVYFGKGVTNATPTAWTLNGTGGSGTNVVGGNLVIAPGPSTGAAQPSSVVIQSTVATTSGSAAQTLVNTMIVTNNKVETSTFSAYYFNTIGSGADRGLRCGDNVYWSIGINNGGGSVPNDWEIGVGAGAYKWAFNNSRFLVPNTYKVMFRDTAIYLTSLDDGYLDIVADIAIRIAANVSLADAKNISVSEATGTKIGTATGQKLGLWNATPIVQPTTGYSEATLVQNSGDAINDNSTFDGYTLRQVVAALRGMGALA